MSIPTRAHLSATVSTVISLLFLFAPVAFAQRGARQTAPAPQDDAPAQTSFRGIPQQPKPDPDAASPTYTDRAGAGDIELLSLSGRRGGRRAEPMQEPAPARLDQPFVVINESEPNNTTATAQPLNSLGARVRADLYAFPLPVGGDVDVYSFFANAGDRVYAATMTQFSAGSTDTVVDIIASDGTTVLETDDEDGAISGSASNIGGTVLATAGTYYVRVRQFSTTSLSGTVRPYDLYVRVQSGAPVAEVEPNNNGGPPNAPNPLPPSGWVSGTINPAADSDVFSVTANAGDTIVAILDADPERDAPEWNPRLGIGLFNNFFLLVNGSAVGGTFDDANPSEAFFMTVKQNGTYLIYIDEAVGGGGATFTYNLSVSVIPGNTRTCTTYAGGTTGAITDAGTTNYTLNIPDAKTIANLQLALNATHALTTDLDVSLLDPQGDEVVLFDDPPNAAGAPAPQFDLILDDEAGIPISVFGIHAGMHYTPELFTRLNFFKGQPANGTWTLRVRDDLAANTGTVNSWSLIVCEEPPVSCPTGPETSVYSSDFEANDGGFTHSGAQDEWERGLPSAVPITSCNSGTNCWKTDLDSTYNNSSNQNLLSPNINLAPYAGQRVTLRWWQKYQMESASFDTAFVEVREVSNPTTNFRRVWEWKGATMTRSVGTPATTVQMAAGWSLMQADISAFAGQNVEVRFHLESDSTGQFGGLAIDDVSVSACNVAPPGVGDVKISEFRLSGPGGAKDEFVELYNNTDTPIIVSGSMSGSGWALVSSDAPTTPKFVVPAGTTIPARGHYLAANTNYSLGDYPSNIPTTLPDLVYSTDIPLNTGIALFRTTNVAGFITTLERLDAAGPVTEANPIYKEGATGYPTLTTPPATQYSFVRKLPGGCTGTAGGNSGNCTTATLVQFTPGPTSSHPQDTGDNAADFIYVDTYNVGPILDNGAGIRLGAPGPENLSSPTARDSRLIGTGLVDSTASSAGPPNRVRVGAPGGSLEIRKRFINNTGANVTRLRFRVMDISGYLPGSGIADLRPQTSADTAGVTTNDGLTCSTTPGASSTSPPCTITLRGSTLETPPAQPNGGGFNSTLSSGFVTLAQPLAPGASINMNFSFGVNQNGKFRVFVIVEALP